jgi:hypothetical protein
LRRNIETDCRENVQAMKKLHRSQHAPSVVSSQQWTASLEDWQNWMKMVTRHIYRRRLEGKMRSKKHQRNRKKKEFRSRTTNVRPNKVPIIIALVPRENL